MSTPHLPSHAVDKLLALGAERDPDAPIEGEVELGRYRLLREVGRGGMGRVYEAEDVPLSRRVALKVIPETAGLSDVLRRRFALEAQAAAMLVHPNIAAVYDATADYIAMQLIDGVSILEVPRKQRRLLAQLWRDAALAVHYAHEQGIIHRDLKPSNLMVEGGLSVDTARVFILDFGLAKRSSVESSLSMSGSIVGTPAYMSPEQAQGRGPEVDARSDVYSLGATFYACLCGRPVFEDGEMVRLLRMVVETDPRPPRVEPDLDAILLKCLDKEPERRYGSARELADDLDRWLRGEPILARPPSVGYRVAKFMRRRKPFLIAIGTSAALAALVLGPLLLSQSASRAGAEAAVRLAEQVEAAWTNAQVLFRRGDTDGANAELDRGIATCELATVDYDIAQVRYFLGRLQRARGLRTAARASLDRAIELDPAHVGARFERGLLVLAEHGALDAYYEVSTETVDEADSQRLLGLEQLARDDLRVADGSTDVLRLVDARYAKAELLRLDGELLAARDALLQVIALDPEHGQARLSLARVYVALDEPEKAQFQAQGAFDMLGGFAPVFLARSQVSSRAITESAVPTPPAKRLLVPPAIIADISDSFSRLPTPDMALAKRAFDQMERAVAMTDEDTELALAAWERALSAHTAAISVAADVAGLHNNRGVCWLAKSRLLRRTDRGAEAASARRSAVESFDEAIATAPRFYGSYVNRARLRTLLAEQLARFGRLTEAAVELQGAERDCTEALVLEPGDLQVRMQRGEICQLWLPIAAVENGADREVALRQQAVSDLSHVLRLAPADWLSRDQCAQALARLTGQ